MLTRGPLFSWRRLPLIAKYTFTRPLAYDPRDDFPALRADDLPAGLVVVDDALRGEVELIGVEPPQIDFADPATSGKCWLGPGVDGELAAVFDAAEPRRAWLTWEVEALGAAIPASGMCDLEVQLDERPVHQLTVRGVDVHRVPIELRRGRTVIRLRIASPAGPGRYPLDPRPLMLRVGGVRLAAER